MEVALRAKGVGSTLFCKDNLNLIDFGTEYTHNSITKEFFLENRGRKQMKIQWVRNMKMERKPATSNGSKKGSDSVKGASGPNDKASNAEASSTMGGAKGEEKEEESKVVFSIFPD